MNGTKERLLAFLRAHQVLTVAVPASDGGPHAAALFYAVDDQLRLYVLTDPLTQHGRAMERDPRVAGTIQRDGQQWLEIQGIQFRGQCHKLTGEEMARGWVLYLQRFPFLQQGDSALAVALKTTALWQIEPTWMRLIDNRLGFGHREEWAHERQSCASDPTG